VTAFLFLFGHAVYDWAKCEQTAECYRHAAKYEGKDFPSSWWWRWTGDLVSSSDTLAQWIMAFFTIAVTLLVWRTLVATQDMASQTREVMATESRSIELEYRPIITVDRLEINDWGAQPGHIRHMARFVIVNHGKTPAQIISTDIFRIYRLGNILDHEGCANILNGDVAQSSAKSLSLSFSKIEEKTVPAALMEDGFDVTSLVDGATSAQNYRAKAAIIACRIRYKFGIGGDDRVFECTAGYSVVPKFEDHGALGGFYIDPIAGFWNTT
tara:strand:- start:98 stop:904 length:807 start_codon:yes stop_codon:yes gene_type:complete